MSREAVNENPFKVDIRNPRKISLAIAENYLIGRKQLERLLLGEDESTRDLTVGVSSLDRTSSDFGKPTTSQSGFYRDKPEDIPSNKLMLGAANFNRGLFSEIKTYASVIPISCCVNFSMTARYRNPQKDGYWLAEQAEQVRESLSNIYGVNTTEELSMPGLEQFKLHTLCVRDNVADSDFSASLGFETAQHQITAYFAHLTTESEKPDKTNYGKADEDDVISEEMMQELAQVFEYFTPLRSSPLPEILARTYTPIEIPLSPKANQDICRAEGNILSKSDLKNLKEEYENNEKVFLLKIQRWGNFINNLIDVLSQAKGIAQNGTLVLSPKFSQ